MHTSIIEIWYETHGVRLYMNAQSVRMRDKIWKGKDNKNLQRDVLNLHLIVGQGSTV